MYWTSYIIASPKPYRVDTQTGYASLKQAKNAINIMRQKYDVISAWVMKTDDYDDNIKPRLVYHDCYVDCLGVIEKLEIPV